MLLVSSLSYSFLVQKVLPPEFLESFYHPEAILPHDLRKWHKSLRQRCLGRQFSQAGEERGRTSAYYALLMLLRPRTRQPLEPTEYRVGRRHSEAPPHLQEGVQ